MAPHNWAWDSGVGVFKNHFISDKLLEVAFGECKVYQFTMDPGTGYGKGKGEYVHMMHVNPLPQNASSKLTETTRIPVRKLSLGDRALKVEEFGEGVEYTNLAEQLSKFKPSNFLQKELKKQMTASPGHRSGQGLQGLQRGHDLLHPDQHQRGHLRRGRSAPWRWPRWA